MKVHACRTFRPMWTVNMYAVVVLLMIGLFCSGCRKVTDADITGKWVYAVDLPETETGLPDAKEATVEFFSDKTVKIENMPAVLTVGAAFAEDGGKGRVFNGDGTWEIDYETEGVMLSFKRDDGYYNTDRISISRGLFGKVTLFIEYQGSHLCFFEKINIELSEGQRNSVKTDYLTLPLSIAMASSLIAFAIVKTFSGLLFLYFAVIFAIAFLLLQLFFRQLGKHSRINDPSAEGVGKTDSMSIDSARPLALKLLEKQETFKCLKSDSQSPEILSQLGPVTCELFSAYQRIESTCGDFLIGWEYLGKSQFDPALIRIGYTTDFIEYAVKPLDDTIYELGEGCEESCPVALTIYHAIIDFDYFAHR